MPKAMDELRAALMVRRQFRWEERCQLRWLSTGNEEQRQTVMHALGSDHSLTPRMTRCGEVSKTNNVFYCQMPLCPRCFMRERGRQTRQAIREVFAGANNEDLAFVTILLPPCEALSDASDLIKKEKRRLTNFLVRQRSLDERWNDFQLFGFWEMGRTTHGDFRNAGRKTKLALNHLGFPMVGADTDTVWLPHLHAVVARGRLSDADIAKALRNDGHSAPYQVDVRRFHRYRSVVKNLQNVIRYSLKFRIENDTEQLDPLDFIASTKDAPRSRDWWPAEDIKAYAEWLRLERSGFQSLRFVLGRGDKTGPNNVSTQPNWHEVDDFAEGSFDQSVVCEDDEGFVEHRKKEEEQKAHGINDVDFDVLRNEELGVRSVRSSIRYYSVRYNNPLLDTNWTDETYQRRFGDCSGASRTSKKSRLPAYMGNIESLAERLHRIRADRFADKA